MSRAVAGKIHDFSLMKANFPPSLDYFSEISATVDLGFQGIESQYNFYSIKIPHKKRKSVSLSASQKEENKTVGSERIWVEHSIGGLKRYRALSDRLRIHRTDFYDQILGVCAGLWNFHLDK